MNRPYVARGQNGNVAQISLEGECALSHLISGDGIDLGSADGQESIHDCDADVDFGGRGLVT